MLHYKRVLGALVVCFVGSMQSLPLKRNTNSHRQVKLNFCENSALSARGCFNVCGARFFFRIIIFCLFVHCLLLREFRVQHQQQQSSKIGGKKTFNIRKNLKLEMEKCGGSAEKYLFFHFTIKKQAQKKIIIIKKRIKTKTLNFC